MLFLRYENFRQYIKWYPITTAILVIQISLFLVMAFVGGTRNIDTLIQFGALLTYEPDAYWRYFSSIFLHSGFDHLLFNSFSLFVFAPPLERLLGKWKYILFYLGSGFIGNLATIIWHQMPSMAGEHTISVGASGAIYGVFAAYIFIAIFYKQALDKQSRSTVVTILVVGVIYSFLMPAINLAAHLGGFVGGFLLFAPLFRKK